MSLKGSMRRRRSGSPRICETRSRAHETCAASEEAGLGFAGRLSVLGPRHPALPQRRPPVRVRVTLLLPGHQRLAPKARAQTARWLWRCRSQRQRLGRRGRRGGRLSCSSDCRRRERSTPPRRCETPRSSRGGCWRAALRPCSCAPRCAARTTTQGSGVTCTRGSSRTRSGAASRSRSSTSPRTWRTCTAAARPRSCTRAPCTRSCRRSCLPLLLFSGCKRFCRHCLVSCDCVQSTCIPSQVEACAPFFLGILSDAPGAPIGHKAGPPHRIAPCPRAWLRVPAPLPLTPARRATPSPTPLRLRATALPPPPPSY